MPDPVRPQLSLFSPESQVPRAVQGAKHPSLVPARAEIRTGDAYDLAADLRPGSIDTILTSPPYWGLRTYDEDHNWEILREWLATPKGATDIPPYEWYREHGGLLGMEPLPEWYIAHLIEIFARLKPAVKATGSVWVNIGDTYFARWASIRDRGRQGLGDNPRQRRRVPMGGYRQEKQLLLIPARFAIGMQEHRWILRNDLIWFKPNVPPRPEKDRLRLSHEHFFHFAQRPSSGRARYYYDLSQAEPGAVDVVTCNVRSGEEDHSATFPEKLIAPRIASSCPPGGTVLDPFAGTGRTLTVSLAMGRSAIGFEISKAFSQSARRKLLTDS
jgi:site-specific DNA-methyltransferase (cytosine-N4-specific)